MLIGYARTSTVEQVAGLEAQCAAFTATGCTKLFSEQASAAGQRDQLAAALDWAREGDTLVVTRLDRLARSTADLLGIVATLEAKQVGLRISTSAAPRWTPARPRGGCDNCQRNTGFRHQEDGHRRSCPTASR
jgi:DNA invertase Pin-like site-specific DNA recombinase